MPPPTADDQRRATPDDVLARLRAGNDRAVADDPRARDLAADRAAVVDGQHPLAFVLSCIDSRVPPEVVLDAGLGELFVARSAGNVVDDDVLGGLEFACALVSTPLVVVLGHTACGAVKGACDGAELGHLTGLLAKITPAVEEVAGEPAPGSGDPALVDRVVEANVRRSMAAVTGRSEVVADLVSSEDVAVVGGVYDLVSGEVRWLD